jgi:hypothetical protein
VCEALARGRGAWPVLLAWALRECPAGAAAAEALALLAREPSVSGVRSRAVLARRQAGRSAQPSNTQVCPKPNTPTCQPPQSAALLLKGVAAEVGVPWGALASALAARGSGHPAVRWLSQLARGLVRQQGELSAAAGAGGLPDALLAAAARHKSEAAVASAASCLRALLEGPANAANRRRLLANTRERHCRRLMACRRAAKCFKPQPCARRPRAHTPQPLPPHLRLAGAIQVLVDLLGPPPPAFVAWEQRTYAHVLRPPARPSGTGTNSATGAQPAAAPPRSPASPGAAAEPCAPQPAALSRARRPSRPGFTLGIAADGAAGGGGPEGGPPSLGGGGSGGLRRAKSIRHGDEDGGQGVSRNSSFQPGRGGGSVAGTGLFPPRSRVNSEAVGAHRVGAGVAGGPRLQAAAGTSRHPSADARTRGSGVSDTAPHRAAGGRRQVVVSHRRAGRARRATHAAGPAAVRDLCGAQVDGAGGAGDARRGRGLPVGAGGGARGVRRDGRAAGGAAAGGARVGRGGGGGAGGRGGRWAPQRLALRLQAACGIV